MRFGQVMAAALLAAAVSGAQPLGATSPITGHAEQFQLNSKRLDAALAAMIADGRAVGTSLLVWHKGKQVYFGASGFADRETKRPMARDTIAQIYSMTKPVTGVALMQLWEQGKFRLDDPLSLYLPEFAAMKVYVGKGPGGAPIYRTASRPIILRDIMRHTAGFAYGAGPTPVHAAFVAVDPLNPDIDLAEMGRRLAKVPLLYDPGSQWDYSIAVDVQALLVEKLSGQSFAQYVQEHIFSPLKMSETRWRMPDATRGRLAAMYEMQDGNLKRQSDAAIAILNYTDHKLTPGGFGLASTVDDYMRFARMLIGKGSLDGVRILKPSTVRLMSSDQLDASITERSWLPGKGTVGFGFDFAVRKAPPASAEENRGATGEFFWDGLPSTLFWVDPANDLTVVFFVQSMPFDGTLHRDIRAAVYGPTYLGPPGD